MRDCVGIRYLARAAAMLLVSSILVFGLVAQQPAADGRVLATRTDESTGARWVLKLDRAHPGGPGRWVREDRGTLSVPGRATAAEKPVIRAGDRIVVEEETAVSEARLEATALTSAPGGGVLRARIAIGGRVVTVHAIAAGRAALEETGR